MILVVTGVDGPDGHRTCAVVPVAGEAALVGPSSFRAGEPNASFITGW